MKKDAWLYKKKGILIIYMAFVGIIGFFVVSIGFHFSFNDKPIIANEKNASFNELRFRNIEK